MLNRVVGDIVGFGGMAVAREEQIQAKKDLAEATKVSAESLLTEALAVKELEKAFGSFEGETFKQTLEEIAKLTGR